MHRSSYMQPNSTTTPQHLDSSEAIAHLVQRFYARVVEDPLLAPYFTELSDFEWDTHIPIMVQFWESMLLGKGTYHGNPMQAHKDLHALYPMQQQHFTRWLALWKDTLETEFIGPKAEEAYQRATTIADVMQHKLGVQS